MSRYAHFITATAAVFCVTASAHAQIPRGNSKATIGGSTVSVEYGRPSLKGRDMLGKAPNGTVWRTGADKSTTFTTSGDLASGGKTIPAGSYSLFTKRVDDKTWHLIFNKQTGQWGTNHDGSQDAVEVPLEWAQGSSSTEEFTIETAASGLKMMWGTHELSLPLAAKQADQSYPRRPHHWRTWIVNPRPPITFGSQRILVLGSQDLRR